MSDITEVLRAFLQQQQAQAKAQQEFFLQQQQVFAEKLSMAFASTSHIEMKTESLASGITEFNYDPENNITFEAWFVRYEGLFNVDARSLDDAAKVRLLLRKLSTPCHKQYVDYILPSEPKDFSFANTVSRLKQMFGKKISLFNQRYNCLNTTKSPQEDFVAYAAQVNKKCEDFQISQITADQFKCLIFVCGMRSPTDADIRIKLLNLIDSKPNTVKIEDLTIECQRLVNLKTDTSLIQNPKTQTVAAVKIPPKQNKTTKFANKEKGEHHKNHKTQSHKSQPVGSQQTPSTPCWFCGSLHYSKDCTYKTHKCQKCNNVGHKDGYCYSNKKTATNSTAKKPQQQQTNVISIVGHVNANSLRKFVDIEINHQPIKLQLDTGSDITVISQETWSSLGQPPAQVSNRIARDASGNTLKILYETDCTASFNGLTKQLRCYVTSNPDLNIIGLDWLNKFNFWNHFPNRFCNHVVYSSSNHTQNFLLDLLRQKFPEVFKTEMGCCTKTKVQLHLKSDARPVFRPKRPVAYSILPIVDEELSRLEQSGIISPVDYSDWAAPFVVVRKKNGKIRICADYSTGLNNSLQPNRHPLPQPDEIFSQLANCKYFSHVDLSDAFLQIEVDEQSRHLLTINTHKGLYTYNRLPFGVTVAPGEFQAIVDSMIAGLDNVFAYIDDLVVGGATEQEHNQNLLKLFERIQMYGFRVRIEKCTFLTKQISYLGYVIDGQGLRPDKKKVAAIVNMPAPSNLTTLRSFLGAINYYARFIPHMHSLRKPLDQLLKQNSHWNWTRQCQESFDQFKRILQSKLLLTHYNPKYEIIVAADASNDGIGACILHRFPDHTVKPICHAARTLTETEKRYSQIEKEGLAIIFAITKFHKMIFGRRFTLQTDHEPLLTIFGPKNGIPIHTANRLQRWALQLLAYDFHIQYIKTSDFGHADVLSRLIAQQPKPEEETVIASINLEEDIAAVFQDSLQNIPITFKHIQEATKEDDILQQAIQFTLSGWPASSDEPQLKAFHRRREALTVVQDCLMLQDRIVIPICHQNQVLNQLHKGHPGIQRMKAIARSYVYWPGMDGQIENIVKTCTNCNSAAKTPVKVPLSSWSTPSKPWERLHLDYAGPINGEYYFLLVDAYSKWPEIYPTTSITASRTVEMLADILARFGLPETIVTDNGTQFTSEAFQTFCISNGITHLRSPPFHPSSNGQAERFVDIFKRGLQKLKAEGNIRKYLPVFLQHYRSTPNANIPNKLSPAEALLGKPLKTVLDLLKPPQSEHYHKDKTKIRQEQQYNRRHGVRAKQFTANAPVYVKIYHNNKWKWTPGKIIERIGQVLYNILLDSQDRLVRAHVNQVRPRESNITETHQDQQLPLNILMEAFNIPHTEEDPSDSDTSNDPPNPVPEISVEDDDRINDAPAHNENAQTIPEQPRRSSRIRKDPSRFKDFLRY